MIYRQHRGGLEESMATSKQVDSLAHLVEIINENRMNNICADDIQIRFICYDTRTEWDTYMVIVDGRPEGFTNGKFE